MESSSATSERVTPGAPGQVDGSPPGPLLFGRYAFPPNQLGYCGPDDARALFEHVTQHRSDQGLLALERQFDGAYPYLRLIAQANSIADPFDRRVVEAYWIGNGYLERVPESSIYSSLQERYRARMSPHAFGWLVNLLEYNARPHHNFHVFAVYARAGALRDPRASISLEHMDKCRISWGQVTQVEGAELTVERRPLVLSDGKLALGKRQPVRVIRQLDGQGFVTRVEPGTYVSIHWNWACDTLTPTALRSLAHETQRSLALANRIL